jgi:hypothetical protein
MWQEFRWQRILWAFFLLVNSKHSPARSIAKQLKTVDSPRERRGVLRVTSGFIGAKRLQEAAPLFSAPRNFSFREALGTQQGRVFTARPIAPSADRVNTCS